MEFDWARLWFFSCSLLHINSVWRLKQFNRSISELSNLVKVTTTVFIVKDRAFLSCSSSCSGAAFPPGAGHTATAQPCTGYSAGIVVRNMRHNAEVFTIDPCLSGRMQDVGEVKRIRLRGSWNLKFKEDDERRSKKGEKHNILTLTRPHICLNGLRLPGLTLQGFTHFPGF